MRVGHKQPRRECGIIRTVMLTKALLIKDLHKTSGALIAVDNRLMWAIMKSSGSWVLVVYYLMWIKCWMTVADY